MGTRAIDGTASERGAIARRSRAWSAVLVALAVLDEPTLAQAQRDARSLGAEELIERGIAAREQRRDAQALAYFRRAHEIEPSGRTLAQIALAEQALGSFVEAEAHLVAALADVDDPFVRRNRALLERALREIRSELGEIVLDGGPDGAEITVDGVARGTLPAASTLRVLPGRHRLSVGAAGYVPFSTEVDVAAGAREEIALALAVETPPEAPTSVTGEEPIPVTPARREGLPDWALPTAIGLGAAAAVGLAIGTGFAIAREDHAIARQSCSDRDPACRARYQAGLDAEAAAITAFVIGSLLAAGAGTVLGLAAFGVGSDDEPREIACTPAASSLMCTARF